MNKNEKARLMAGLFDSEVFVGYLKTIGDLIVYLRGHACAFFGNVAVHGSRKLCEFSIRYLRTDVSDTSPAVIHL